MIIPRRRLVRGSRDFVGSLFAHSLYRFVHSAMISGLCPRHIREGLASVAEIVKKEKIAGAFGPLVNLFDLTDPRFRVPVEVMAKNQLFNYVVDTEATAALLIAKLQKAGGALTFVPLDVVRAANVVYPEDDSQAVPLIKCVRG